MGNNNLNSKGKEKSDASDLIQKIDEFKEKERKLRKLFYLKNPVFKSQFTEVNF